MGPPKISGKFRLVVATQRFFYVHPENWGNDPIWLIFLQMGWNHQLARLVQYHSIWPEVVFGKFLHPIGVCFGCYGILPQYACCIPHPSSFIFTPSKFNIAHENEWLEDDRFFLDFGLFSGPFNFGVYIYYMYEHPWTEGVWTAKLYPFGTPWRIHL